MPRRAIVSFAVLGIVMLTVSCGKGVKKTVGIAKFVAHPSLDVVEPGIVDEIKAAKPDVEMDQQNSNADMATAGQLAQRFKERKVVVAVGIATPTAQALVNQIKDRPAVYSVVTDPVPAGLVESMDRGEANVTGTWEMTPARQQLDILLSMAPVKRLGHLYASGEASSVAIAAIVKAYCKEKGIEYIEATVTNSSEVTLAKNIPSCPPIPSPQRRFPCSPRWEMIITRWEGKPERSSSGS